MFSQTTTQTCLRAGLLSVSINRADDLGNWRPTAWPVVADITDRTKAVTDSVEKQSERKARRQRWQPKFGMMDLKVRYTSIAEAKKLSGLRLILGAYAIPGPWREVCKGIFHVKKIPYTPVTAAGADGSERELREWTAQNSAPVAIWNDERPHSTWIEQLY